MRIFRIVAIAVAVVAALVVVGAVALLLFVDPNRYRGDIQHAAQQHTGRDLAIKGKLELKVFPWLAVAVHDVELGNPPGFGTQPFATVENASIGVKLLPLLSSRLEVSTISISGVTVNLISRGEQNNWKDLSESKDEGKGNTPATGNSSSGTSGQGSLSIEGVDVTKTTVALTDEVKKTITRVSDFELHSGGLRADPAQTVMEDLSIQGTYLSGATPDAPREKPALGAALASAPTPLPFSLKSTRIVLDGRSGALAP